MIENVFYYTHNKYGVQKNIDRHRIKFHELTFLINGKMTYYIDDQKYDMISGDIIYLPAGSMRQRDIGDGHNEYIGINFHAEEKLALKNHMSNSINNEIELLLAYLDLVHKSPIPINPQKINSLLETIVMQISDNMQIGKKIPLADEIAGHLKCNYKEQISLEEISRITHFSVAYCESEFKKAYGKSIVNYVIDLRLSKAKHLLMETSLSCVAISKMVGFDDANYFSRVFKKRIGFSPLKYRTAIMKLDKSPL